MTTKNQALAYILKFAREENLAQLEDFLVDKYPVSDEYSAYNSIPTNALYKAIDILETAREQDETREVRELMQYYDDFLALPSTVGQKMVPAQKIVFNHDNIENYPFAANILASVNHPLLPNLFCTTTAARDITVSYIPYQASDHDNPVPIILAHSPNALHGVALSAQIILVQNQAMPETVNVYLLVGLIDGHLQIFYITTVNFTEMEQNPATYFQSIELTPQRNIIPVFTDIQYKLHAKYLTKISIPTGSSVIAGSTFRIITGSHDNTIIISDITFTTHIDAKLDILKQIEFSGKVEALCGISTPCVLTNTDTPHPVQRYPSLIPTERFSRYHLSKIRKLPKGNYMDNVEFITHSLPFNTDFTAPVEISTQFEPHNAQIEQFANLLAVSVRNDPFIHIIDVIKMEEVDNINVNITGDTHVSFTVLDLAYDPFLGILYMATDNSTVLLIDTVTKQHIRRLYCTENNELSTPLMKLIHIDDKTTFPKTILAITTSRNNVKLYNPHTQQEMREYQCNTKNIKSFAIMMNPAATDGVVFNIVTAGFDKTFSVQY